MPAFNVWVGSMHSQLAVCQLPVSPGFGCADVERPNRLAPPQRAAVQEPKLRGTTGRVWLAGVPLLLRLFILIIVISALLDSTGK